MSTEEQEGRGEELSLTLTTARGGVNPLMLAIYTFSFISFLFKVSYSREKSYNLRDLQGI